MDTSRVEQVLGKPGVRASELTLEEAIEIFERSIRRLLPANWDNVDRFIPLAEHLKGFKMLGLSSVIWKSIPSSKLASQEDRLRLLEKRVLFVSQVYFEEEKGGYASQLCDESDTVDKIIQMRLLFLTKHGDPIGFTGRFEVFVPNGLSPHLEAHLESGNIDQVDLRSFIGQYMSPKQVINMLDPIYHAIDHTYARCLRKLECLVDMKNDLRDIFVRIDMEN